MSLINQKIFYLFIFSLGLFLRFNYINDGIWPDEWISFYIATSDLNFFDKYQLHIEYEGSPPINLIINNLFYLIVGYKYQNIELLYLIANLFAIIYFLKFTNSINEKFLVFFLLILNPFLIYYSGELRLYSVSLLFSVLSVIYFLKVNEKSSFLNKTYFILFSIISLLINIYTISLLPSYIIFNFLKKKNNTIYICILIIILLIFLLNLHYLMNILNLYSTRAGAVGNINLNFFIGYFFNIFFGNIYFGSILLLTIFSSIFYFKTQLIQNDRIFISFLIIIITYLIPITLFFLFKKNITFPRHLIFIIPFIVYIVSVFILSLKNHIIKKIFIIFIFMMVLFSNFFYKKSFMEKKPNPETVVQIINKSNVNKLLIHGISIINGKESLVSSRKVYCSPASCGYEYLAPLYTKSFRNDQINILINNDYKNQSEFWSICLHAPSYKGEKFDEEKIKNCYGKLNFLEKTHFQAEEYIRDEFKLTLYKIR